VAGRTFVFPDVLNHVRDTLPNASGNSETFSVAAPTVGDIVLIGCSHRGNAVRSITSITQTNVAWTVVKTQAGAAGNFKVELWKGVVSASPGTSIVIAFSGNLDLGCVTHFIEFGQAGTTDQTAAASGNSSTPATGNLVTTHATEIIVAYMGELSGATAGAPINGFEMYDGAVSSNAPASALSLFRVTSTGTYSTGWTTGSNQWAVVAASFY
jgi:hypothetical protein